ncbi:hypothetical protein [Senegalia massiliensis]|uniref:hypothetical protein n=1 Tax=Senegalia massiliensis TaxID=1720316 RepID=UPI001FAC091C|nr:hypothetical protein [Senegalia massiliensis]
MQKNHGNIISIISFIIPLIMTLFILNWYFKITPYQRYQGLPLMLTPIASIIGIILANISFKRHSNNLAKLSIIFNTLLFFLPFAYWILGTIIWGP